MTIHPRKAKDVEQGFTLIEIIVGLSVIAIALVLITSIIVPAARQSVSPIYQVRAAELGASVMNEIMSKSFDQENDRQGVHQRCVPGTTCSSIPNPELAGQGSRSELIAVEQYNGLTRMESVLGADLSSRYARYSLAVDVCYADPAGVCQDMQTSYKRILVTVTTPEQQSFQFSALRGNF